jgi:hypothetical protein
MDTSLKADTIHGVQPTKIGSYMLDSSQVPKEKICNKKPIQTPCSVRHYRHDIIDNESVLRGLDRKLSKLDVYERPSLDDPKNDIQPARSKIVESFVPFESESTREKRPCNVLSGIHIDRFENPLIEPQDLNRIIMNESYRGGFQSRINAKDCNVKECGTLLKLKPGYGNRCLR